MPRLPAIADLTRRRTAQLLAVRKGRAGGLAKHFDLSALGFSVPQYRARAGVIATCTGGKSHFEASSPESFADFEAGHRTPARLSRLLIALAKGAW